MSCDPAPPPTDPEKPALLVTQPSPRLRTQESKASGPQIQLLAPPEAPVILLATAISPGEKQVTTRHSARDGPSKVQEPWLRASTQSPAGEGGGVTKSKGSLPNPGIKGAGYCGNKPLPAKQKQGGRQGPRHQAQRDGHTRAQAERARDPQDSQPDAPGRNRAGSCGQVLSHTAAQNHRNAGTPRSGETGRHQREARK